MTQAQQILSCITETRLQLILLPTEACNFRCSYCYEDFGLKRMRPAVVRGVKRLLDDQWHQLELLRLTWFGGEPLLARDLVEELMIHVRGLLDDRPGVRLASDMTTNGYLLGRETFAHLLNLGLTEYQITLDGPRDWHDRRRARTDGRRTFDRIWTNLLDMLAADGEFEVTIRVHVDGDNSAAMPAFLETLQQTFGADPRFDFFVRQVSRFGGPCDDDLPLMDDVVRTSVLESLKAKAAELGLRARFQGDGFGICYAARGNSFVVRADGRLNKCTVALADPRNQVGRLAEDGSLQLDPFKTHLWLRGLLSKDVDELQCPMKGLT